MLKLANCSFFELLEKESSFIYIIIIFLLSSNKTNKTSNKEYISTLYYKNLVLCTISALAMLFF